MAKKKAKKSGKRTKRKRDTTPLSIRLLRVANELEAIDWLLQTIPDLEFAAQLAKEAGPGQCADPLAEWARDAFGVDLDAEVEDKESRAAPFDLSDLPNAVDMVIDAARWRIRRVERLLTLAARHWSKKLPEAEG